VLKAVDEFVRMRVITRSVEVALKCLIAAVVADVVLPLLTSKVEHLVAFAAIVSNILLCMRRNCYLGNSGKSFFDLATFSVDILHFISRKFAVFLLPVRFPAPIFLPNAKFWRFGNVFR